MHVRRTDKRTAADKVQPVDYEALYEMHHKQLDEELRAFDVIFSQIAFKYKK